MAEEDVSEVVDKYDFIWVFGGISFALLAVVALKFIFDIGNGGNCYHSHFHGAPNVSHHGAVYGMDSEGKIHRRGYL